MIFVTVGHQMPFDRMIRLVDQWAAAHPDTDVFAQIGESPDSGYRPQHMEYQALLTRDEFDACLERCDAVIAHAGAGTIIEALRRNKPLLVLPRLSEHDETRNDHQVGTARHFAEQQQLLAAFDDQELLQNIDKLVSFRPARDIGDQASPELLARLRAFMGAAAVGSG
ncbi:MAG: hypothetical protein HKN56_09240 [Gammaproteobacteria bacterium]|nr:hypothetical protein [Gammaproteobacteria bacterium]NND55135.1 hypothetical protein [Gammaproteobacteria bacterium]